jgi:hypothetical protein
MCVNKRGVDVKPLYNLHDLLSYPFTFKIHFQKKILYPL